MFQKKFKQFMAATLSAAMLIGQVQYAQAAETNEDTIDISDEYDLIEAEDAPELTPEEISDIIDSEGDTEFNEGEVEILDDASEESVDEEFLGEDTEVIDDASFEEDASEEEVILAEEADLEETVTEDGAFELPEGVVGMPEDYELTLSELSIKDDSINDKDTYFNSFAALEEGKDYAENEVVFLSETEEHAEEVAAAYAGEVKSFENGVAVIDLSDSEVTVASAYSCAFIEGLNLPVVTPNFFFEDAQEAQAEDEALVEDEEETAADAAAESEEDAEDAEDASEISADEKHAVSQAVAPSEAINYAGYVGGEIFSNFVEEEPAEAEAEEPAIAEFVITGRTSAAVMVNIYEAIADGAQFININIEGNLVDPQMKSLINDANAASIAVQSASFNELPNLTVKAGNKAKKVTIVNGSTIVKKFTLGTVSSGAIKTSATFTASADNGSPITWKASKSALKKLNVKVSKGSVTVSVIPGSKPGTVKLTAAATGKKATLSIKIINPVSGTLDMQYPAAQYRNVLANGGYYKMKVKATGAAGLKPTKKTIKWTYGVRVNGTLLSTKEAKKIASVSGGKVSAKKTGLKWLEKNYGAGATAVIYPIAYSTDGTNWVWDFHELNGNKAWALQVIRRPRGPFGFRNGATYDGIYKNSRPAAYYKFTYTVRRGFFVVSRSESYIECYAPMQVTSSNESILKVSVVSGQDEHGRTAYYVQFAPQGKAGTAKVTVKTLDGTHLSTYAYFKVS